MAIDPTTVNILNVPDLQQASNIQDGDLLVLAQGITAKKITVLALYEKFGIDVIKEDIQEIQDLEQRIQDLEGQDYLLFSAQILSAPEQQTARDNIDVYSKAEVDNKIKWGSQQW